MITKTIEWITREDGSIKGFIGDEPVARLEWAGKDRYSYSLITPRDGAFSEDQAKLECEWAIQRFARLICLEDSELSNQGEGK